MAQEWAELIRNGFEAFSRGDLDYIRENVLTEDTVWHVSGRSQLAGDFNGVDEVLQWFGRVFELSGGTFSIGLHDVATSDEHAVALTEANAERAGKRLEGNRGLQVHHFRDGKISETWLSSEDPYTLDEFWG